MVNVNMTRDPIPLPLNKFINYTGIKHTTKSQLL